MNRFATMSLAALLSVPAIGCAQDRTDNAGSGRGSAAASGQRQMSNAQDEREGEPQPRAKGQRRLESVTWNSIKHQLTWVISKDKVDKQDKYEINMDNATMTFNGESRRFSKEEASNVHMLMDLVSKYAVDSTIWWDQGQGQRLDRDGRPVDGGEGGKDDGKVKVLRVSAPADARSEIRALERRLEQLKAQQRKAGLKPASY